MILLVHVCHHLHYCHYALHFILESIHPYRSAKLPSYSRRKLLEAPSSSTANEEYSDRLSPIRLSHTADVSIWDIALPASEGKLCIGQFHGVVCQSLNLETVDMQLTN